MPLQPGDIDEIIIGLLIGSMILFSRHNGHGDKVPKSRSPVFRHLASYIKRLLFPCSKITRDQFYQFGEFLLPLANQLGQIHDVGFSFSSKAFTHLTYLSYVHLGTFHNITSFRLKSSASVSHACCVTNSQYQKTG